MGGGADERMIEEILSREPTLLIHVQTPGRLNASAKLHTKHSGGSKGRGCRGSMDPPLQLLASYTLSVAKSTQVAPL